MKKILFPIFFIHLISTCLAQNSVQAAFPFFSKFPAVRDFTISTDGNEAYFTIQNSTFDISVIAFVTKEKGNWSKPAIAKFSGRYKDLEPFISPDGLRLYFVSNRPLNDTSLSSKDFDIWYMERKSHKDKWSEPVNIGAPVNTQYDEFYPSVTANKNMYFTCDCPNSKGSDDVFFSKWDNAYSVPVPMDSAVNSVGSEFNAFVAPDESFIIFSTFGRSDRVGGVDLYISFRNADGTWKNAENMGKEINSKYLEYCPFVDMNTGVLYFTSNRFLSENKRINTIEDYLKSFDQYQNGTSKIYKINITEIIKNKKITK